MTDTPEEAVEEVEFMPALQVPETRKAMTRRRYRIYGCGAAGFILIFIISDRLIPTTEGVVQWLARLSLVAGAALFFYAVGAYVWLRWYERILRLNPWVTWTAKATPITIWSRTVGASVTMTHADWPEPVVRRVLGRFPLAQISESGTAWAAGNPERRVLVSPEGGAIPAPAFRLRKRRKQPK